MKLVFMGTTDFSATILEDLVQHHEVCAVYTRPDAIRGRGQNPEPSAVKKMALALGIPVFDPPTLKDVSVIEKLKSFNLDGICVAAYGAILPKEVLEIPVYGCLNVHASLLPAWRGAAPIERAILAGDAETGVCVMRMREGLDTGEFCVCRTTRIEDKSANKLSDELANLGSHALLTALIHLEQGAADWTVQNDELATYAQKIEKGELNLCPEDSATLIVRKIQASSDAHPARCVIAGRAITVITARDISRDQYGLSLTAEMNSGEVCFVEKRLFLGTADFAVEILEVKPDGKGTMDAKSFAVGVQGIKQGNLLWEAPKRVVTQEDLSGQEPQNAG